MPRYRAAIKVTMLLELDAPNEDTALDWASWTPLADWEIRLGNELPSRRAVTVEEIEPLMRNVAVLCGCGWGSLSMPEDQVPAECPVCGGPLG